MQPIPSIHPTAVIDSSGHLSLPTTTHIEANAVISIGAEASVTLGEKNTIYPGVVIRLKSGELQTGHDVSLGPGVVIYETRAGLRIGDSCMIAAGVKICGVGHGMESIDIPMRLQPIKAQFIEIEDDVWIGMNSVIHPGVRIGAHSIIGSGSIVTKSIPPYSIAYGSPCRVVRTRTSIAGTVTNH